MATEYKLLKAIIPTINTKTNVIVKDSGVGGIKLKYLVTDEKKIHQHLYFIKPYKKHLASNKKECEDLLGKRAWGNTSDPLGNVWFCSHVDYKDLDEINSLDYRMSLQQINDVIIVNGKNINNPLIPCLNKQIEDLNNKIFVVLSQEEKEEYTGKPEVSKFRIKSIINNLLSKF